MSTPTVRRAATAAPRRMRTAPAEDPEPIGHAAA